MTSFGPVARSSRRDSVTGPIRHHYMPTGPQALQNSQPLLQQKFEGRDVGIDSVTSAVLLGRALLGITGSYSFGPCLDGDGTRVALRVPEQGRIVFQHDRHPRMVWS